jgi:hypothetical protein
MNKPAGTLTILLSLLISSCAGPDGNANSSAPTRNGQAAIEQEQIKTNAEELGLLVRLPYETEDIVWRAYPASKRIIAVMKLSRADADRIATEAGSPGESTSVSAQSWFPDELIAQNEMSGDSSLKGTAYPATTFYQEPYSTGKVIRIEGTDFVILDVSAE